MKPIKKVYRMKKTVGQYKCEKCERTFIEERFLTKHLNRKTPCDKTFPCSKCGKVFKEERMLNNHLDRKNPCVPDSIPVVTIDNLENKCHYCGKTYSNVYNLKRHVSTCDKDRNMIYVMEKLLEKQQNAFSEQINQLQQQLISHGIAPVTNNITNNVQQNLYMNVTICSFGNEDLSQLDTSKVMQLLRGHVKDFMSKMIEYIHANPEHPELHNVFYDPVRKKAIVLVPISETEMSWQTRDFREVSDILTDRIRNHVAPGNGPYFDLAMRDKDYDTSNNIINIAKHINWKTDESVEMNKTSLGKLANDIHFMNQVQELE